MIKVGLPNHRRKTILKFMPISRITQQFPSQGIYKLLKCFPLVSLVKLANHQSALGCKGSQLLRLCKNIVDNACGISRV